jgi:uncharacterized protein
MSAKIAEFQSPGPRTPSDADLAGILALNAAHETELSPLTEAGLQQLLAAALYYGVVGPIGAPLGCLIVLDQDAPYTSPNFLWFRRRLARFAYIDRIVIDPTARGAGHANALYTAAFAVAKAGGHATICCEVNQSPPNPASDRFHARLGFIAVGQASLPPTAGQPEKIVQYLQATLRQSAERNEL